MAVLSAGLLMLAGCGEKESDPSTKDSEQADADLAASLVASEELILALTPRLRKFEPSLFSSSSLYYALEKSVHSDTTYANWGVRNREWATPASAPAANAPALDDLVTPPEGTFPTLSRPRLAIVSARFHAARTRFRTEIQCSASAPGVWIDSRHTVDWIKTGRSPSAWQISAWNQTRLTASQSPTPLFEEVLDKVVPDPQALAAARTSLHQKILVDGYFGGTRPPLPKGYSDTRFFPDSTNIHPALSVVDVDGDGHDDLYVCVRWGRNLLLRNRGDGTFEECAARYGLDIDGRNTVALFADFDNDGDPDLLLGRSLERSLFLVNVGGRFEPHAKPVSNGSLPWLVTSASAADFNNDGLLDLYICTYSPLDISSRTSGLPDRSSLEWARRFLPAEQAAEVVRRRAGAHSYLSQVGPPNVLLLGRGTHFEIAPDAATLLGYRNSFHAAWSDFDQDGDQDLYVANDFAPDHFFRNDGAEGFSEVASEIGLDGLGFAMGAAWGDYDGDGWDDVYVSNMYSKAGRRITGRIPGLDRRFSAISGGNFLYRNRGDGTLERVSGADDKPVPVHDAGWSWGGQFCDFDNDGHLDLYVSSGFYTPPPGEDIGVDL